MRMEHPRPFFRAGICQTTIVGAPGDGFFVARMFTDSMPATSSFLVIGRPKQADVVAVYSGGLCFASALLQRVTGRVAEVVSQYQTVQVGLFYGLAKLAKQCSPLCVCLHKRPRVSCRGFPSPATLANRGGAIRTYKDGPDRRRTVFFLGSSLPALFIAPVLCSRSSYVECRAFIAWYT
jgi:hypothetical protein